MDKQNISIVAGFQNSINISYDLGDENKIKNFIPTMSSIEVIEDILLSTAPNSNQRARLLVGAYGRGKSHIILVLLSLLYQKNTSLYDNLVKKMYLHNKELAKYTEEYINSEKKLLPIVISGSSTSLTQSFLNALQQSLKLHNLESVMPETHFQATINVIDNWKNSYPKTYKRFLDKIDENIEIFTLKLKQHDNVAYETFEKIYPELTSGSVFNPFIGFDVVELYEETTKSLREYGYNGIYVVYDEFSKYLESSISNTNISDIKLLQDFAEKCERSGSLQMHLMLISHKDISNYIDEKLPKEKVDGWRGVSGRFKHINLHNNFSQMYEIITAVIKKDTNFWNTFIDENKIRIDDLKTRFVNNNILSNDEVDTAILGCYPLHPISTFILPRLSEKIAQNERTLFTFLSAEQKHTLSSFLETTNNEFNLLTPDYLYDYFEPLFKKEVWTSDTYNQYKLTETALRKVDDNSLEAKIVKTISLIYIVGQYEKLPPIYDIIADTFIDNVVDIKLIDNAIKNLVEKECIIYLKRSNNYFKLKKSSDIDIRSVIENKVAKISTVSTSTQILNEINIDNFIYPTKYNDENDIIRFFEFTFINSDDFFNVENWESKKREYGADGSVFAVIPKDEKEIKKIVSHIKAIDTPYNQTIFAVPKKCEDISNIVLEYYAVLDLKSSVVDDDILAEEYDIYIDDLQEIINNFIASYLRPELNNITYFYLGKKQKVNRKAQISLLLSNVCKKLYPKMPIVNNEVINKNVITSAANNSRNKLINAILSDVLLPNLALTGTGQDVSFMRSTLLRTNIIVDIEIAPKINLSLEDDNMKNMLETIQEFFVGDNSVSEQNFNILYDKLTSPNYKIGLKQGLIPIYIAIVLHLYKKDLIVKHKNNEVKITADLLELINKSPKDFTVIRENWTIEKLEYITKLEKLFSKTVIEQEKQYNSYSYIVSAMNKWFVGLPKYVKESTDIYMGVNNKSKPLSKERKKFINTLKIESDNQYDYLFNKVPKMFGMSEFSVTVIDNISSTKNIYDSMLVDLFDKLLIDLRNIFSENSLENATTISIIKDWLEQFDDKTQNYLFNNNENKILDLIKNTSNDEHTFVQRLGKLVTSLRIEDWNKNTIKTFLEDIVTFKNTIEEHNNKEIITDNSDEYQFSFKTKEGYEKVRTFSKMEYSKKAKLLYNDIESNLGEYGQAVTEQEKRQILIELLEKLC